MFGLSHSQDNSDQALIYDNGILIKPTFTFQIPGAEMAHRFGVNSNFGINLSYKFGKNWTLGGEGNFLFGNKVKEDGHVAGATSTVPELVITGTGALEEVILSERGGMTRVVGSKTFPFNKNKPNSGLEVGFGAGYMFHKILIDVNPDVTPQLSGDYAKGYDRLSHGLALTQYIGIIKLEEGKLVNLSLGLEFTEGITRSARSWDFFQGRKLDKTRFDFLVGLKLSWIIPVFTGESNSSEYYYY